ncbi:protein-serine,threonine phosphatase [Sarracenia purpurea var. burkii]
MLSLPVTAVALSESYLNQKLQNLLEVAEVGNQEAVDTVIRSCLIEKKLGLINRDQDENGDRFGFINRSTSSMLQRISPAKKKKKTGFWPSQKKIASGKEGEDVLSCENESPRPPKTRRISFQTSTKIQSPNQKKKTASVKKKAKTYFLVRMKVPTHQRLEGSHSKQARRFNLQIKSAAAIRRDQLLPVDLWQLVMSL